MPSIRASLLLACLALAPPAQANIFGTDNRRLITPADHLSAVGLIVCEGTTRRPTATLISVNNRRTSDLIISVAHAFLTRENKPLTSCAFWPEGQADAAVPVVLSILGTHKPTSDWNNDWSVARLTHALPARYQPLSVLNLSNDEALTARAEGEKFMLAGHNGETGPMMLADQCGPRPKINADINRFDPRAYNHDCDMMPGWSGGPFMLTRGHIRYVTAVNATELNALVTRAGEAYDGAYNANTAVRIDGTFLDTINRFAREQPATPY